jgi:tubby-related protein 1
LYHETDAGDVFMLSARRRKKSKNSNYLLSLDQIDLSRKSPNCVGKVSCSVAFEANRFPIVVNFIAQVRSNMLGTAFSVYDGGENPEKSSAGRVRHELAAIE